MTLQAPDTTALIESPASETATRPSRRPFLARLRREDSGQDLIEYALAAALIGLSGVSSMNGLASSIANTFGGIGNAVANAIPADPSTGTSGSNGGSSNNNGGNNGGGGNHHHGGGGGFGGFGGFGGHHHH